MYSNGEWQVHSNAQCALVAVQHGKGGQLANQGALLHESTGNIQLLYLEGVYLLLWLHFHLKRLILLLVKMS